MIRWHLIRNPRTAKKYERLHQAKERRHRPTVHAEQHPKPTSDDEDDPNHDFFAPRGSKSETEQEPLTRQSTLTSKRKSRLCRSSKPQTMRTRLAVSSMISYFGDRILTPEMMRAMIILYVGPYNRPDFTTDHLLCPAVAPEGLLAKFPKTYFLTGERDPLVDDTVIFAGRVRQAKLHLFRERLEIGLEKSSTEFNEKDHVEVTLIPGISHGFVSFVSIFPQGWKHVFRCGKWIQEIFAKPPHMFEGPSIEARMRNGSIHHDSGSSLELVTSEARHHSRRATGESMDDDAPLIMSSLTTSKDGTPPVSHANGMAKGDSARRRQEENEKLARNKSLISLGSEEDLLKRRMKGLTVGLLGSNDS